MDPDPDPQNWALYLYNFCRRGQRGYAAVQADRVHGVRQGRARRTLRH
jgi:hypothetical protein